MKDSTGVEVMTVTEFIAHTYRGGSVKLEASGGFYIVKRRKDGFYTADGRGKHSLDGIRTWFGVYHAEFGSAVFYPR